MFNTARYLDENFGSPDGVVGLASKHGVDVPDRESVRKWFARSAVPGPWFPILHLIAQRENAALSDVERYFVTTNDIFA